MALTRHFPKLPSQVPPFCILFGYQSQLVSRLHKSSGDPVPMSARHRNCQALSKCLCLFVFAWKLPSGYCPVAGTEPGSNPKKASSLIYMSMTTRRCGPGGLCYPTRRGPECDNSGLGHSSFFFPKSHKTHLPFCFCHIPNGARLSVLEPKTAQNIASPPPNNPTHLN